MFLVQAQPDGDQSGQNGRSTLSERMKLATYATRTVELDLFEQVLRQMSDDAATSDAMDGISEPERIRLASIKMKMAQGAPPDPFDRILLDKASRIAEQIGKKLSRKTLRSVRATNVQLLTIMAHSPLYQHADRMRALKQLEDMRGADPAMTQGEVSAILELPLAEAYGKIAELTLLGRLSREQADQTIKALDYRNHAKNVDFATKYGKRDQLPATQANGHEV